MKQKAALLAILVAMLVSAFLQQRGGLFGASEDPRSAAFLAKMAAQVNRDLPKMVDADTELTKAAGLDGVFGYEFRLVNISSGEIDGQGLVTNLKPQVTKGVCSAPGTRDMLVKDRVVLRYSYSDKAGNPVASFDINPDDCGS